MSLPNAPAWNSLTDCLAHRLLSFGADAWTVGDAVMGTQVFGGTGSGKTRGSGRTLAAAFIRAGFGGLVLTAKPDDVTTWLDYFMAAGATPQEMRERIVILQPADVASEGFMDANSLHAGLDIPVSTAFNVIDHEYRSGGQMTHSLVTLLLAALTHAEQGSHSNDPFWQEALRELLVHTVDLAVLGAAKDERISIETMLAIVSSAALSPEHARSSRWREPGESICFEYLRRASKRAKSGELSPGRAQDLEGTIDYWMRAFPGLADKTRGIIVSSFTAKLSAITRHPLREFLCGATDTTASASPADSHRGKVIIVNVPVKLFGETGRFAQVLYKLIWQRDTERRIKRLGTDWRTERPVFLWCDESQNFLTREDAQFQQTARSSLAATVCMTQNISNYYATLGGHNARQVTDSLLGNLQTKIFHANGDTATNEWAERLYGKEVKYKPSLNLGQGASTGGRADGRSAHQNQGLTLNEELLPVIDAKEFSTLSTGGPRYKNKIEAYIYQASRRWQARDASGELMVDATGKPVRVRPQGDYPNFCFHVFEQSGTIKELA